MTWEEISKELFEKRTAKRFKFNGRTNCIEYDNESILLDSYGEDIEELLNEQHETIQRLKQNIDELLSINVEEELLKENEQLKAQLLYDGDGVCNICKHQCLVKTGRYYVAKCEKEHEECSKVDLKYCEDFELVRDYE